MSVPVLCLRPGKEKPVLAGHPWIFSGALEDLDPAMPAGTLVDVRAVDGRFLGRGYVNPRCAIAVRLLARNPVAIDAAFVRERVETALQLRRTLVEPETNAFRLLNGEGDFVPGIIADVYGEFVVVQCLTAGARALRSLFTEALTGVLHPAGIYERSAGAVRHEEGLPAEEGTLAGVPPPDLVTIREGSVRFDVDLRRGQKTGFFLDQRENRRLAARLAPGRVVLNAFAYSGGFAVHAGAAGARHVVSVDTSARALALACHNWDLNALPATQGAHVTGDVFRYLRETGDRFDLIVLDPPALVKRRADVQRGAHAYRDLHVRAFRRAAERSFVLTFSCSQHVSADLFAHIVQGAAAEAGRAVQLLRVLGPGADHPVSLAHPEGHYLKGLLLYIL
jgi:23S rRNA (cytosine1962-C5)-methyltransferase